MQADKPISPADPRIQEVLALHRSGQLDKAAEKLLELLAAFPRQPQPRAHLGSLRLQQGRVEEALGEFDRVIEIQPDFGPAYGNRALALEKLGRLEEALKAYDRALSFKPEAWLYFNRGNSLRDLGRLEEAVESYALASRLDPKQVEALSNQGALYLRLGQPGRALENFNQALLIDPENPDGFNNRGNAFRAIGKPREALEDYDHAIALAPDRADAWNNRGIALQELGRLPEAVENYGHAIELQPAFAFAYWNQSQAQLLLGEFTEGWRLYEWRWKSAMKRETRNFVQPLWLGGYSLKGKTLLIWAEQGMGDILQYSRYVPLVEALGARVIFEVPQPLFPLLKTLRGNIACVEVGGPLPDFDLHCPLISLPLAFKTTLSTVPVQEAYLFAEPSKAAAWAEKLGPKTRPRIGLAWSGRPEHSNDHNRSMALETLAPLLELPFEFHSLQKDIRAGDQEWLEASGRIQDHRESLTDFSETAALAAQMDGVVTVDASTAHLAGALGKPIWVLLPFAPDYRWLLKRSDSPWYPTALLLRQETFGNWDGVIERAVGEVKNKFTGWPMEK
ncbi:MAG: tetratricopeptide repeat protein [bacterium]